MIDFEKELNKEQYLAVTSIGSPVLIIAGAGTGKTRVITYKIAYMINELGIAPSNILAITFTNKASQEMKLRLRELLNSSTAHSVAVGTFHSTCLQILRNSAHLMGIKKRISVVDQDDRLRIIRAAVDSANLDKKEYPARSVLNTISSYKNSLGYLLDKPLPNNNLALIFNKYQESLEKQYLVDFDDMLSKVIQIFQKHPEQLEMYQDLYKYILVDEYQDTNHLQDIFLKMIAGDNENICVVGDDDQAIYGWRGAVVDNILGFDQHYQNAQTIKLVKNYRSDKEILDAANSLIKNNNLRKGKELVPVSSEKANIDVINFTRDIQEAEYIGDKIQELLDKEVSLKDITILYRTNAQSRNFEVVFNRLKLPYKVIGGVGFYQRREIKDILAYIRFFNNPYDEVSFDRALRAIPKGIGTSSINKIISYATENNIDLYESSYAFTEILKGKIRNALVEFLDVIDNIRKLSKISDIVNKTIELTGYKEHINRFAETTEEEVQRISNLEELYNAAVSFEQDTEDSTLEDFLSTTSLTSSSDEYSGDSISLMTIHTAKGLEFEHVFVTGVEQGLFPLESQDDGDNQLEEERRLAYVAITRAKKNLTITYSSTRMRFGITKVSTPSIFIKEAFPNIILKSMENAFNTRKDFSKATSRQDASRLFDNSNVQQYGFKAGSNVTHPVFGSGKVISIKGDKVDVIFEAVGLKKIIARFLTPKG